MLVQTHARMRIRRRGAAPLKGLREQHVVPVVVHRGRAHPADRAQQATRISRPWTAAPRLTCTCPTHGLSFKIPPPVPRGFLCIDAIYERRYLEKKTRKKRTRGSLARGYEVSGQRAGRARESVCSLAWGGGAGAPYNQPRAELLSRDSHAFAQVLGVLGDRCVRLHCGRVRADILPRV